MLLRPFCVTSAAAVYSALYLRSGFSFWSARYCSTAWVANEASSVTISSMPFAVLSYDESYFVLLAAHSSFFLLIRAFASPPFKCAP